MKLLLMKNFLYLFLIFLAMPLYSQDRKEFVITKNRDTIYGQVGWYTDRKITIKVNGEARRYAYEELYI